MLDKALAAGWGPQAEYTPRPNQVPMGKNLTRGFMAVFTHQFPQNVPTWSKPEISVCKIPAPLVDTHWYCSPVF